MNIERVAWILIDICLGLLGGVIGAHVGHEIARWRDVRRHLVAIGANLNIAPPKWWEPTRSYRTRLEAIYRTPPR